MRDLLNLLDSMLGEASNLSPSELLKHDWRFDRVIKKIDAGDAFVDQDNNSIIIDPQESQRLQNLKASGQLVGPLRVKTLQSDGQPGEEIALSALKKTADLQKPAGGVSTDAMGQQKVSKENALVKPSLIGICDKDIPATDLYEMIVNNSVLNSTSYGKEVVKLAQYIVSGEVVLLAEEYTTKENEQIRKAIVDYAGEYLGVLALLYQRSNFPKQKEFLNWLGGSTDDLVIFFPSKANTNIADSYASITNPTTSHSLNISSKGTGGGAAPAISGLKISDDIKLNPKLKTAVEFIEICQSTDRSGGPSTITQAFAAMDLIYNTNPGSLPKKFHKFLPFSSKSPDLMQRCVEQIKTKSLAPLPKKYQDLYNDVASDKATDGGCVVYTIKKAVQNAVNNQNAIPEFSSTILQVLEMNFIQQYADYDNGEITFATQWPAKLDGDVSIENKSSAVSPTDGGFSFKLGRPAEMPPDTDLGEPGDQDNAPQDLESDTDALDAETNRPRLTGPGARAAKQKEPDFSVAATGREKRQPR